MQKFSISFTLGKSSVVHQTNIAHSNREFIAKNVDQKLTHLNVTYVREDVRDAYNKLFGRAVAEYNQKQKRADRKIADYYDHIANGKREETFYEAIVQFGDCTTAPCGSANGKIAQQKTGTRKEVFYDLKIRLRNLSGYAAFLFLSYFILSATAVVTATSKR